MNIKSLSAFSRLSIRRAINVSVVGCALVLGVASAQAGDDKNSFAVIGKAGNTDDTGKLKDGKINEKAVLDVSGSGKFKGAFEGDNLVLEKISVNMGKRQEHADKELDLKRIKITIPKSNLTLPKPGAPASGTAKGSLLFNGKTQEVTIKYDVEDAGEAYNVKSATFTFNYVKHMSTNKPICVPFIGTPCVVKDITIKATNGHIKK